nr:glutaredoxin 3 [Quercus suber]
MESTQLENIEISADSSKANDHGEARDEIEIEKREIPLEEEDEEEDEDDTDDITETSSSVTDKSSINDDVVKILQPHSLLPKPEAPRGLSNPNNNNNDDDDDNDMSLITGASSIGKFIRERSNEFSVAIVKRLSSLKENSNDDKDKDKDKDNENDVTQFDLSGLKVIVKQKNDMELKGRISFFSRSNCRDSTAVRRFFREKGLKYVEINIDVYPEREKELVERTGTSSVPQIFFNDKLFGGLVALNSLRNSGGFDQRVKEMLSTKCPSDDAAPASPVYGFDDQEEESTDEMISIVKVLRQRLPIQDRLMKMKIVKNCFSGREMVEVLIHHFDCGRKKAVYIGLQLGRKHFIHHVFGYVNLVQELHRVNLLALSENEKLAFFLNLYNAMVIHAVIRIGCPEGVIDRRFFFSDFQYLVGGYPYSLNIISHGILRNNRRAPYSLVKPFGTGDKRLELAPAKVNPLVHFGLCNGTRSSPTVRFFSPEGVESELRCAAREFFQGDGMEVDLEKRTVYLTRIIKWCSVDFGNDKEILKWILNYLDATKSGLLTHLLGDGGPINIVYQDYNWSLNS